MTINQLNKIIKQYDEKMNYINENYDDYFEPKKETLEEFNFYQSMHDYYLKKLTEKEKSK